MFLHLLHRTKIFSLQDVIDKTNRLEASKNDLQKQVDGTKQRIKNEEDVVAGIQSAASKVTCNMSPPLQ